MNNLDEKSLDANIKEKTVVLFHATWCPFCRKFKPEFESYDGKTKPKLAEIIIDEDENPLWDRFKINVVPTLIAFENGKEIARREGKRMIGLSKKDMDSLLQEVS